MISKGAINSRMKDYHDLVLLARNPRMIDLNKLQAAIEKTFHHRGIVFELIDFGEDGLTPLGRLWAAHLKNLSAAAEALNLPASIQDVITEINNTLTKLDNIHVF